MHLWDFHVREGKKPLEQLTFFVLESLLHRSSGNVKGQYLTLYFRFIRIIKEFFK